LIVQAVKLEQAQSQISPSLAKSETRRFPGGNERGSSQDEFKQKVVDVAAPQGISQRTVERAIAKDRGPVQEPRQQVERPPRTDIPNIAVDRIARDAISYLADKFRNLKAPDVERILKAITDHFRTSMVFRPKAKRSEDILMSPDPWEVDSK
jgi:hypothetical protein